MTGKQKHISIHSNSAIISGMRFCKHVWPLFHNWRCDFNMEKSRSRAFYLNWDVSSAPTPFICVCILEPGISKWSPCKQQHCHQQGVHEKWRLSALPEMVWIRICISTRAWGVWFACTVQSRRHCSGIFKEPQTLLLLRQLTYSNPVRTHAKAQFGPPYGAQSQVLAVCYAISFPWWK